MLNSHHQNQSAQQQQQQQQQHQFLQHHNSQQQYHNQYQQYSHQHLLNHHQQIQQQNHQHHQHQQQHINITENGNSPSSTTKGYFIFDDLTTALQEQTSSSTNNNDKTTTGSSLASTSTTATMSSNSSSTTNVQQQNQQQQQHHYHQQQKSSSCFGADSSYHLKILVPSVAAGAIIGKGGETIAALQKDSGARVKMSKSHDFYPGSTERVCLITGAPDAIMTALEFIMEKIREKPDLTAKATEIETKQAQERDRQVKILVPNSTAGMVIGKAGAFIKQIKEDSGSYIQISQKPKDIQLQERCITIIGDAESNKAACRMILSKIIEDPQSGTCLNVSYSDVNGPVANCNPTGSPYATNQNTMSASNASLNSAASSTGLIMNGSGVNLSLNLGQSNTPNAAVISQILEHIKHTMRGSGFSDSATNEVCTALGILAKYGVLGVNVGVPHTNGTHAAAAAALGFLGVSPLEQAISSNSLFGAIGQVNMDNSFIAPTSPTSRQQLERYETTLEVFRQATSPITLNSNTFGLATGGPAQSYGVQAAAAAANAAQQMSKSPTPAETGNKDTRNVEIPEIIVGAILGPNGRNLIEIQHKSGAIVQISKKGTFAPGTRNRIVTITGQPNAIVMAHYLIEQSINDEESKRARQNPVATGLML